MSTQLQTPEHVDADPDDVQARVLSALRERVSTDAPTYPRWQLLDEIEGDVPRRDAAQAIDELVDADALLSWREEIAPADEPILRAVIGNENMSTNPNRMLIVLCKRLIELEGENGGAKA